MATSGIKDRVEQWEARLRGEPILALLILGCTLIVAGSQVTDAWSHLMTFSGLKQELSLQLATEGAKGDFSRRFAEMAWTRLFWIRNFSERKKLCVPQRDLDYTWDKHLDTVAAWSGEIVVNINGFAEYYPNSGKSETFDAINQSFGVLEETMKELRFCLDRNKISELAERVTAQADQLNRCLYWFALHELPKSEANQAPDLKTICSPIPKLEPICVEPQESTRQ